MKKVAKRADAYDGIIFADIFMQEAESAFRDSAFTKEDKEELRQLGQYLGYLDITQQENAMALFQQELERKIQLIQSEIPAKKRLYQSLGLLLSECKITGKQQTKKARHAGQKVRGREEESWR